MLAHPAILMSQWFWDLAWVSFRGLKYGTACGTIGGLGESVR